MAIFELQSQGQPVQNKIFAKRWPYSESTILKIFVILKIMKPSGSLLWVSDCQTLWDSLIWTLDGTLEQLLFPFFTNSYDILNIEAFPGLPMGCLIIIAIEKIMSGCTFGLIYLKTINIGGMIIS